MVDLLFAFHFGRIMWEVLIDGEGEMEGSAFVHALIRLDRKCEVEDVVWVGKGGFHCLA